MAEHDGWAWVSRQETAAYHLVKIYCSVCGTLIEPDLDSAIFKVLRTEWQHSKNSLYCTAAEVQNRYFDGMNHCAWVSLYRLIIKDCSSSTDTPMYRLSGISQHTVRKEPAFLVPVERDDAVIGLPTPSPKMKRLESVSLAEDLQKTTYYIGKGLKNATKFGYPIHARCWSLCERVIGPDVERHLEPFLEALRQGFRKRISPRRCTGMDGEFAWGTRHRFLSPWTLFLHRDPVQIPTVDDLIKSVIVITKLPRRYRQKQNGLQQTIHFHYPFQITLPQEVQCLIWNYFSRTDITTLHKAFTGQFQWQMPDSYWITRARSTQVFEIQDLFVKIKSDKHPKEHLTVDWESLCLRAEELVHTSEELRNRRRIMRILEGTNKLWCTLRVNGLGQGENYESLYESDCPDHGYDGYCRDGLSVGSSIYEDEDDANGIDYKGKFEDQARMGHYL